MLYNVLLVVSVAGGPPLERRLKLPFPPIPGMSIAVGTYLGESVEFECKDVTWGLAEESFLAINRAEATDVKLWTACGFAESNK